MNENEMDLLARIKNKCKEKPEFLTNIIQVGIDSLIEKETEKSSNN